MFPCSYLAEIEARLAKLEDAMTLVMDDSHDHVGSHFRGRSTNDGNIGQAHFESHNFRHKRPADAEVSIDDDVHDSNGFEGSADAMGAVVFADEEDYEYFGNLHITITSRSGIYEYNLNAKLMTR